MVEQERRNHHMNNLDTRSEQTQKLSYLSPLLLNESPRRVLHELEKNLDDSESLFKLDRTNIEEIKIGLRMLQEAKGTLLEIPLLLSQHSSFFRGNKYYHEGSSPDTANTSEGEAAAKLRIERTAQKYLLEIPELTAILNEILFTLMEQSNPVSGGKNKIPQLLPLRLLKGVAAAMISAGSLGPISNVEHPQTAQSHLLDTLQQNESETGKRPGIGSLILSIKKSLDIPIEDNTNIHRDPPQVNEETSVSQPLSKERRNIKQTVELETTQVTEYDRKVALAWLNVDPDKGNIPSNFAVNDNTIHILKNANGDWSISWANTELSQKFPIKTDTKLATAIQKHLTAYSTTFDDAAAKEQDSFLIVTFDGLDVVIASKIAETVQRSDSLQPVITKGIEVNALSSKKEKVQLPLTGANEIEDIIKITEASQKYFAQFGIETRVGSTIMISYIKTPSGDLLLVRYMTDEGSVFVQGPTITKNATATGTPTPTRDEGAAVLTTDKDINFQNAEAKPNATNSVHLFTSNELTKDRMIYGMGVTVDQSTLQVVTDIPILKNTFTLNPEQVNIWTSRLKLTLPEGITRLEIRKVADYAEDKVAAEAKGHHYALLVPSTESPNGYTQRIMQAFSEGNGQNIYRIYLSNLEIFGSALDKKFISNGQEYTLDGIGAYLNSLLFQAVFGLNMTEVTGIAKRNPDFNDSWLIAKIGSAEVRIIQEISPLKK